MHIITFTRSVPQPGATAHLSATGAVTWEPANFVANPDDDYAVEETLRQASATHAETTAIAVGPVAQEQALNNALAMGIQSAMRVEGPGIPLVESLQWATLAAAAVHKISTVQLILASQTGLDTLINQAFYQTARKLGWPLLDHVSRIVALDLGTSIIQVEQTFAQHQQIVTASLPAVVSVTKGINEPRLPTLARLRRAAAATIPVWNAADLGVTVTPLVSTRQHQLPAAQQPTILQGATPAETVSLLVDKLMDESVL